jgi:hypothetical protein
MAKTYTNPDPKVKPKGLIVTFDTPVVVKEIGTVEIKSKDIEIQKVIDNSAIKTVAVMTTDNRLFKLWVGAAYDAIGNWTDQQVINRVKELVLSGYNGEGIK